MAEGVDEAHSTAMLRELAGLWSRRELCDVTLRADGVKHRAHKVVLAAASPYFQGMFLGSMREQSQEEVEFHGISKDIFTQLLEFIYKGSICVTAENCQELLAGADMLQLPGLLQQCSKFLEQELDPSNVLGILEFADLHNCSELKLQAESYAEKHFLQVISEDEFVNLSKEHLVTLLESEYLRVEHELQLFHAAVRWLLHDIKARRKFVFTVCAPIRFPIIPRKELELAATDCPDLSLQIALQKLICDYKTAPSCTHLKHKLVPWMFRARRFSRKCVYVVGGWEREAGQRWGDCVGMTAVHCLRGGAWTTQGTVGPGAKEGPPREVGKEGEGMNEAWTEEAGLHQARSGHGACVLGGRVYAVGGENEAAIFDSCEIFEPGLGESRGSRQSPDQRQNQQARQDQQIQHRPGEREGHQHQWQQGRWRRQPGCLLEPRCGHAVCAVDGAAYVIGGWVGAHIGTTVERYDADADTWHRWDAVPNPRHAMGAVQHEGLIYLAGGNDESGSMLKLFESYNPVIKEWEELPSMHTRRGSVALGVLNNKLYAVGGVNEEEGTLDSVERYDIDKMKWEWVPSMHVARAGAMVASVDGFLYVMGGRGKTLIEAGALSIPPPSLASVERFDPETERWSAGPSMPVSRCDGAAVVL